MSLPYPKFTFVNIPLSYKLSQQTGFSSTVESSPNLPDIQTEFNKLYPNDEQLIQKTIKLQEKLFSIKSKEDIAIFLDFFKEAKLESRLQCFVKNFLLAICLNPLYSENYFLLLKSVNNLQSQVKSILLDFIFTDNSINSMVPQLFSMLRYFYSQSFFTKDEILKPIKTISLESSQFDFIKVYFFIWFAPEIASDPECFEFKQNALALINNLPSPWGKSKIITYFKSKLNEFESTNYQSLLNEYLKEPNDPIIECIIKDDSKRLAYLMYTRRLNQNFVIENPIFTNNLYSRNYSIVDYALIFSAENCLLLFSFDKKDAKYDAASLISQNNNIISFLIEKKQYNQYSIDSAIIFHNIALFYYLFIHYYYSIEITSEKYYWLLSTCVEFNSLRIFSFLLQNSPVLSDVHRTPLLHQTIQYDNYEMFLLLYHYPQTNFNEENNDHETALHYAINHNKIKYVEMLSEKTKISIDDAEQLIYSNLNNIKLLEKLIHMLGNKSSFDCSKIILSTIKNNNIDAYRLITQFVTEKDYHDIVLAQMAIKHNSFEIFKDIVLKDTEYFLTRKVIFIYFFF